jgi:hypothetical protein
LFGGLLIVAAVLKIVSHGQTVRSVITDRIPFWADDLLILGELLFEIHLLIGRFQWISWLLSLALLFVFLIHTSSLAIRQSSSCGCFGSVKIPPSITLLFDVFMIGLLLRCRPRWDGNPVMNPTQSPFAKAFGVMSIVLIAGVTISVLKHGSISNSLAVLKGRNLIVSPESNRLVDLVPNSLHEIHLTIHNYGLESVDVHLMDCRCRCAEADNLPVTIQSGESADLTLRFQAPAYVGPFQRPCVLLTSSGDIPFEIVGNTKQQESKKPNSGTTP